MTLASTEVCELILQGLSLSVFDEPLSLHITSDSLGDNDRRLLSSYPSMLEFCPYSSLSASLFKPGQISVSFLILLRLPGSCNKGFSKVLLDSCLLVPASCLILPSSCQISAQCLEMVPIRTCARRA